MPVKILVVDDSETMRSIMSMTFAGEDAEVVTVADGQAAIAQAQSMKPDIVFADVTMTGTDGYAVSEAIKKNPALKSTAVILLASQHTPYDAAKGKAVGVDDHVAKPFDTQVVIDRVAQVLSKPRNTAAGGATAGSVIPKQGVKQPRPATPAGSVKQTMAFGASPVSFAKPKPAAPKAEVKAPQRRSATQPRIELGELDLPTAKPRTTPKPASPKPAVPKPAAARPARPIVQPKPKPQPKAAPAAAVAAVGGMESKLKSLGLNADQIAGVLSLSREVVEQVVWEVVPDMAETLIREEIKRLTQS